jgi:peptide/nickel transport system substrate-binding protein
VKVIGVGNGPAAVAVGEGAVWVANRDDGTVSRIDPATNAVSDTVGVGGSPTAIATGHGALWIGDASGGAVVRIDPRTRRVTRRVEVRSSPVALVVDGGSVWTAAVAPLGSHRGGTLRYETGPFAFCGCIDPVGYDGRSFPVLSLAYDGLVAYRRVGGAAGSALVGDLATNVPAPADGGRTFVFQLRAGIRFSDGRPVRPRDFRASIERGFRLASPGALPFAGIVGARACGPRHCDLSKGIETDAAARTITIHLTAPDLEFLHKLALPFAYLIPAASPLKLARTRALPGTGPYRVASFGPGGGRLVRNTYFRSWSQQARPDAFPDQISVAISNRPAAQVAAVREGRADVLAAPAAFGVDLPIADVRALSVADASRVHSAPAPATDYLFLNARHAPFDDVRVRRALNYAIDRRRVLDLTGGSAVASVTCQIIPPGLPGYVPSCPYTKAPPAAGGWSAPDLTRARRLVAESGTRGARVTVRGFAGSDEAVVRYASAVLRRLGYRSRVRIVPDIARYFRFVGDARNRVQIGFTGWVADFLTPSSFFLPNFTCRGFVPRANGNLSQFCDPTVDAAFDRAVSSTGPEADAPWAALDRRVVAAAPAVPLVNGRSMLLVSDRVGNVQQHLLDGPLLDQLWVR